MHLVGGYDYCPICGGPLEYGEEIQRLYPPGAVYEVLVCQHNPSHLFYDDGDGELTQAGV